MTAHAAGPDDPDRTTLLDRTDAPAAPAAGESFHPGQQVGPYRLVELLGEGGMGQVFLADQQQPIRRRVALKLMRHQLAGSLAEAYFEIERQALARMEHPAIAKVFDAGRTDQGFPYFAMEFVEGRPLDHWCENDKPASLACLQLFVTLAYGVQHAHQRGIVHRDLKPSNVLVTTVDGRPQPKLIDFGIAIGLDQVPGATPQGSYERAGSGPYMSPEQFHADSGGIDIRTDIYSLGVVLLGILLPTPGLRTLGQPVPARAQLHERVMASLQRGSQDPVLDPLPRELRHVVARAIDPQRERRYDSATALAEDVQRYVDGDAVEAVPPTTGYRLSKFVRRQRRPLAVALAVAVTLVAGLAVALGGLVRAEREATRAQATAEFLATVLAGVDPDQARELDKTLLRAVLDDAALRAGAELADQPEALAQIEGVIADSYTGLGEFDLALTHAERSHRLAQSALGPDHPDTLARARGLGRAQVDVGLLREAEPLLRDTLDRLTRVLGADALITLKTRQTLGWLLRESGRFDEAEAELARAIAGLRASRGDDDPDTIETRFTRAIVLGDLERFDESIAELRELAALRTRLLGAEHPRTLSIRNSLAVSYLQSRRYAEGERELMDMLPAFERVFGPEGTSTLMVVGNLGGALRQQGKVEASGPWYQRAADALRERFGPSHPRALQSRHNFGNYLFDAGRYQEAYDTQAEVVRLGREAFGASHAVIGEALEWQGRAAAALGDSAQAEQLLGAALAMKTDLYGPDSARVATTRRHLDELRARLARGDADPGLPLPMTD
jgi:non-specific serine/threonine protein kinase/serine/threonine-protein kinase